MGRIRRLFKGTLPMFSALWLWMMLVLLWLNSEGQSARMGASMQSYRWSVEYQYSEIWNGSAAETKKPVILTWRLMEEPLYSIGGITQTRVYDRRGRELARRPMAMGTASPIGTGVYTWSLLLDPVLSEEEQLSLAERLRAEPGLGNFFGTAGGFYEELETGGLYCEVVGGVDEKREVIYPQRLTYCYADREITLVDTDSGFFDGRELVTLRFDGVQLNSALVGVSASPRELLQTFRAAETSLDALLGGDTPTTSRVSISSDGSECAPMSDGEIIVATAYTCNPLRVALRGQGPTAVLTLLAAVGMAVFTDRRQRETLERERAFTRAAAHELKTPLAVLRTHAEALREDIAPARRGEYLDVVLDESDRMAALVGSLLELSRMEEGGALHREVLAMDALVRAVFDRLALPLERKGLHLKLNLEPGQVFGDRHGWRARWKTWPPMPCGIRRRGARCRCGWNGQAAGSAWRWTTTAPVSPPGSWPTCLSHSTGGMRPAAALLGVRGWGWPLSGRRQQPTGGPAGRRTGREACGSGWSCRPCNQSSGMI